VHPHERGTVIGRGETPEMDASGVRVNRCTGRASMLGDKSSGVRSNDAIQFSIMAA
jgi:hypothetical protein